MVYDEHSPSSAAPARARSNESPDGASENMHSSAAESPSMENSAMEPVNPAPQNQPDISLPPPAPQLRAGISDDLQVPWGWQEVALFVILLVIGSVVVTRGMAEIAVRLFGVNANEMFGDTMSTAKSVVVLLQPGGA